MVINIMANNCKQTIRLLSNLLRNGGYFSKGYATTVADYKITWVRPDKISCTSSEISGDQGLVVDIKPTDLRSIYDQSPELKDANDLVKKMFTLQFLSDKGMVMARRGKILELVKRHEFDEGSAEALIALMTSKIHHLRECLKEHPYDKRVKVCLKELIEKRRKRLKYLRAQDYRRFEWVLEKLNLVYKPLPEPPLRITRKDSLRRLTNKHCDKLTQDKLDAYKTELKILQKDFYKEKVEKLAFIREEQLACGLQPSVSEEDIAKAKQKVMQHETHT